MSYGLNFVDIGDVLAHDYLQGIITAKNAVDDTCTVVVDDRTLTDVPLFFNGGSTAIHHVLPSGYWSIYGAELDFEIGDKVLVMIGRAPYEAENFVIGQVDNFQKLRYYLADFKRIYALHPTTYYNTPEIGHYVPDQINLRAEYYWVWRGTIYGPYNYPSFSIPIQSDTTPKEDWFLRNSCNYNVSEEIVNTGENVDTYDVFTIAITDDGLHIYPPLTNMPYRSNPQSQIYTFRTTIIASAPAIFYAKMGNISFVAPWFTPVETIITRDLYVGVNNISFDFQYKTTPGSYRAMRIEIAARGYYSPCSQIDIYSILPKVI